MNEVKILVAPECIDIGDTTWMMVATLLVLCMMPALSFFEAGLLRKKNSLSIISQIFMGVCVMTLLWYVFGFSLVFGKDHGGIIGDFSHSFFMSLEEICSPFAPKIPGLLFAIFEMMFACITPLLMTGAFAERLKFRAFLWIIVIWEILVYYPIAHQIWGDGWLGKMGVLDFAGGITIHTTAGVSSLIIALFLGRRKNFEKYHGEFPPHNVPLASIGACLLFVGWFGFNGGSSFSAGLLSTIAITNTTLAACISGATWAIFSRMFRKHFGTVEILNGMIAGLAGITPASGFIHVRWALIVGFIIGVSSWAGVALIKGKLKVDDALDVSSVHGIPGIVGAISIGFFASVSVNPAGADGIFHGGGGALLGKQLLGILIAMVWSGVVTLVLLLILKKFTRMLEPVHAGLDKKDHGNLFAYDIDNNETQSELDDENKGLINH